MSLNDLLVSCLDKWSAVYLEVKETTKIYNALEHCSSVAVVRQRYFSFIKEELNFLDKETSKIFQNHCQIGIRINTNM